MHVLVSGGSGFIGCDLVAQLLARGHRVTAWTRDVVTAQDRLPGVRCVRLLDELATDRPDGVVNLAGENLAAARWTARSKSRFVDSRTQTTRHLVNWLLQGPLPQVMVSGSAIGLYGARNDELVTEASAAGRAGDFTVELCRAWEAEVEPLAGRGARVCWLRTGIVLERDGGSLQAMLRPFRWSLGGPIGSGRQWMSWIHRRDLVALIIWLLETPTASGVYNGTAPHPVRNREFARALGRALRRPAVLPLPAPVLRLMVGEMADIITTGQKVLPVRALEQGFRFRHADLDAALGAIFAPPAARN